MLADLLSEDAHHLYQDLVASGDRPAGDGLDDTPALRELIQHGLAFRTPGPARRICAVSPIAAMRRMLACEQRDVIRAHRRIIERYAELEHLERHYPAGAPPTGVLVLIDEA